MLPELRGLSTHRLGNVFVAASLCGIEFDFCDCLFESGLKAFARSVARIGPPDSKRCTSKKMCFGRRLFVPRQCSIQILGINFPRKPLQFISSPLCHRRRKGSFQPASTSAIRARRNAGGTSTRCRWRSRAFAAISRDCQVFVIAEYQHFTVRIRETAQSAHPFARGAFQVRCVQLRLLPEPERSWNASSLL